MAGDARAGAGDIAGHPRLRCWPRPISLPAYLPPPPSGLRLGKPLSGLREGRCAVVDDGRIVLAPRPPNLRSDPYPNAYAEGDARSPRALADSLGARDPSRRGGDSGISAAVVSDNLERAPRARIWALAEDDSAGEGDRKDAAG